MNEILQNKIDELEIANDYQCWYLVKHPVAFDNLCYLVSFLKMYQDQSDPGNLQEFIKKKVGEINNDRGLNISSNYRALRVASFFGLIIQRKNGYNNAEISETFYEITDLCSGNYEDKDKYNHIIQRQIEKMYISSSIDEESNGVRSDFRLYPVLLLYKILNEMGKSSGNYKISINEYRYFVATTEKYEKFLDTLLLIDLSRKEPSINSVLEKYRTKFDNRLILALQLLDVLEIDRENITLKTDYIDSVAEKVYKFEQNPEVFNTDDYLSFLGSKKSLFDLKSPSNQAYLYWQNISDADLAHENTEFYGLADENRVKGGTNVLLYGVPGSGKSYTVTHDYCDDEDRLTRLVFHPDYTYSDFVGQILPVVDDEKMVSYVFTPGPFTKILKQSYLNPSEEYFLMIEEINRGNAPAIFGEVFQLLDRDDDGRSEYGITNADIAREVYGDENHKVRIPSNMSIIGTMNTSDQNVFTLDTAFQRRWNMRMVENDLEKLKPEFANHPILDTTVTWKRFNSVINEIIVIKNTRMTSSEDKRLGAYFIRLKDLEFNTDEDNLDKEEKIRKKAARENSRFPEKVIKYLWDDAFKFKRDDVFDVANYNNLEEIVRKFKIARKNDRFAVFKEEVRLALIPEETLNQE